VRNEEMEASGRTGEKEGVGVCGRRKRRGMGACARVCVRACVWVCGWVGGWMR
jgi:hypothetical protein